MLIEFSVGNFRSFREEVTFSMVAAAIKSKDPALDANNTFTLEGQPTLLTSAAIYGANASGKSNLVKAMSFMRRFVLESPQGALSQGATGVEAFALSTETEGKPSHFEMVFIAEGTRYRYGFEATGERVTGEWLYYVPRKVEARLFERDGVEFHLSGVFKEGRKIEERTRPNALFLSTVAQWNGKTAQTIARWFHELTIIAGLQDLSLEQYRTDRIRQDTEGQAVIDLLLALDLDIDALRLVEKGPGNGYPLALKEGVQDMYRAGMATAESPRWQVYTVHPKYSGAGKAVGEVLFALDEQESEGTRKLFALAAPLTVALGKGGVLIVDELDARLHPAMTAALVQRFNSQETNPNHAQLIFTTHDTNLLGNNTLRRDQVWFVEKDRYGGTDLFSLVEFKVESASGFKSKVRNDASFEKDYIAGRYGAIPYLSDLERLGEPD